MPISTGLATGQLPFSLLVGVGGNTNTGPAQGQLPYSPMPATSTGPAQGQLPVPPYIPTTNTGPAQGQLPPAPVPEVSYMASPWIKVPGQAPAVSSLVPGWFSWGQNLPPAAAPTTQGETGIATEQKDMLAYLWMVNELLPWMTPRGQAEAANLIYENRPLLEQYWPEAYPSGEGSGRYVVNWANVPTQTWSEALSSLGRGAHSIHYGGFDLANALKSGGMGDTSAYQAAQALRSLGTELEGQPQTAGQMRNYIDMRNRALASLGQLGSQYQQLGEWFTNPSYNVPAFSPLMNYSGASPAKTYGGARSWWR